MEEDLIQEEIKTLELQLKELEEKFMDSWKIGSLEECSTHSDEIYKIQRKISLAKKEETALLLDWQYMWNTGAPCPFVISASGKTFLIYYMREVDPNWDGTYVNVVDSTSDQLFPLALVEFIGCYSTKFGGNNDETISGHPLYGRGLETYQAHVIENSKWIQEEMQINSVHSCYNKDSWKSLKHFLFVFHDELFECISKSYKVTVFRDTFSNVILEAHKNLMNNS